MACQDCIHYLPSDEAFKPRPGLEGHGYCKAAPDYIERSRLFLAAGHCWLKPVQEKPKK